MPEPKNRHHHAVVRDAVIRGLASCATAQDVVQVLDAGLPPVFGYDTGVLQDPRHQQLSGTSLGELYEQGRTSMLDVQATVGVDAVWVLARGCVWLEETGPGATTFCFTVPDAASAIRPGA